MLTTAEHKAIATEILSQLGGYKFVVMTGAKNIIAMDYTPEGGLRLDFPMCPKTNRLSIVLDPGDTYTMTFSKYVAPRIKRTPQGLTMTDPKNTVYKEFTGVYCDMLQDLFTETTGLHTSLGTLGR